MKKLLWLVTTACMALFAGLAGAAARNSETINRDWNFTLGDPSGAQAPGHDVSQWQRVDLPHSFSQPYFLGTGFYVGHGWYRKALDVPTRAIGKRISLEFDGVFQDAEVWVNGRQAGHHVGGYTGFSIDITPYAQAGRRQPGSPKRAPAWHIPRGVAVPPPRHAQAARMTTLPPAANPAVIRQWWRAHPEGLPRWRANGALPPEVKAAWTQHLARAETVNGSSVL